MTIRTHITFNGRRYAAERTGASPEQWRVEGVAGTFTSFAAAMHAVRVDVEAREAVEALCSGSSLVETDEGVRCTWGEFQRANEDTFDEASFAEVARVLATRGEYTEGSGASAGWSVRLVGGGER